MDNRKKKQLFILIVAFAIIILISVGSTFAYFSITASSEENAVSLGAAVFKIDLKDDTSLIKTALIPSAEKYVDMATIKRLDEDKNFIHPYEENGKTIKDNTACIDDNLNEICSIYTFTIQNPMTDMELPASVKINPTINTFQNLYFKVVDEEKNVVMPAQRLIDDRPYEYDINGEKVYEPGSKISPVLLTGIDITLPKATKDETTGEIIPAEATYSIIMWIMEIGQNQTKEDSRQIFASALTVESTSVGGNGITGVFTAGGEE